MPFANSNRCERVTAQVLAFLIVSVALVPYRYLALPVGSPDLALVILRHLPTAACLLLGGLWLWQKCVGVSAGGDQARLNWPVTVVLLAGLLSAVGARDPAVSIAKTFYYFATGGFLFIGLSGMVRQRHQGRTLLCCLLGSGYVVALYGIVEFAFDSNVIYSALFNMENEAYRRLVPDPWFEQRIVSTIGHPVYLGSYLALLLPLSLAAVAGANGRRRQVIPLLGSLALAVALLLTFSRGAWLAATVGVGVLFLLKGSRRLLLALVAAMIVLAAGVLSVNSVAQVVVERARDTYRSYVLDFGSTTRGAAYGYATVMANQQPITGLGTGMYRFTIYDLRRELDIPTPLGVSDTPDNMYLMWLTENGGIGLVAAVYVLVALLQTLWRWSSEEAETHLQFLSAGFIAAFAGFMVNMLTVDALYFPSVRTTFWIMAGVAVVVVRPAGPTQEQER